MTYVMESVCETARLLAQQHEDPFIAKFTATGLSQGMDSVDVGCGPGLGCRAMAELVGAGGSVLGIDISPERIKQAEALMSGCSNVSFKPGTILGLPVADGSVDYTFSQYVLQYLADVRTAVSELIRVTRVNGKVVVSEIDGFGFHNWPMSPEVERGLVLLVEVLAPTGFDIAVGRKMFHLFRQLGLTQVKVHLLPIYVLSGAANERVLEDWQTRFTTLESLATPRFGSTKAYRDFCNNYLSLLRDPDSLKYAVCLVTEGTKQ